MNKWFILLVLAAILVITPTVSHAQGGISLLDSSAQIYFPSALAFNIKAQSQNDIVKLRLHYQVDRMNYAPITNEAWPAFTPSTKVQTQWVWDMRKASLPAGATVTYWWTIEDTTGDSLTTPSQKIRFDDLRFNWMKVTSGQISLFWYKGNQSFIDQLTAACQQALDRLAQDTGVHLKQPVSIYIYATPEDLRGAMVFPQEWTGGVAFTEYGIIAIGIPINELDWGKGALAHELGHMVTHQITFSPYGAILPTWLDEGLAMYAEGKPDPYLQSVLQKAITQHNLISVRSLSSPFSAIPEEAYISYAESQSLVPFLIQNYGRDKMLQLLNLFKEGSTYDDALIQVYGFDQDGLDALWQKYITSQTQGQSELQYDSLWANSKDRFLSEDILGKPVTVNILLGID
jgi:hypothetical protein